MLSEVVFIYLQVRLTSIFNTTAEDMIPGDSGGYGNAQFPPLNPAARTANSTLQLQAAQLHAGRQLKQLLPEVGPAAKAPSQAPAKVLNPVLLPRNVADYEQCGGIANCPLASQGQGLCRDQQYMGCSNENATCTRINAYYWQCRVPAQQQVSIPSSQSSQAFSPQQSAAARAFFFNNTLVSATPISSQGKALSAAPIPALSPAFAEAETQPKQAVSKGPAYCMTSSSQPCWQGRKLLDNSKTNSSGKQGTAAPPTGSHDARQDITALAMPATPSPAASASKVKASPAPAAAQQSVAAMQGAASAPGFARAPTVTSPAQSMAGSAASLKAGVPASSQDKAAAASVQFTAAQSIDGSSIAFMADLTMEALPAEQQGTTFLPDFGRCGGTAGFCPKGNSCSDAPSQICSPASECVRISSYYWQCQPREAKQGVVLPTMSGRRLAEDVSSNAPALAEEKVSLSPKPSEAVPPAGVLPKVSLSPQPQVPAPVKAKLYSQCGGAGETCPLTDQALCRDAQYLDCEITSNICTRISKWYWQCLPDGHILPLNNTASTAESPKASVPSVDVAIQAPAEIGHVAVLTPDQLRPFEFAEPGRKLQDTSSGDMIAKDGQVSCCVSTYGVDLQLDGLCKTYFCVCDK